MRDSYLEREVVANKSPDGKILPPFIDAPTITVKSQMQLWNPTLQHPTLSRFQI